MSIRAVVYTSNTGYTAAYAEMIGEKLDLPVFSLDRAVKALSSGAEVIYLGWLMGGAVKGLKKAERELGIRVICGVGMLPSGTQIDEIRTANQIDEDIPVFTFQGGFDLSRLQGMYKLMIKAVSRNMEKELAARENRSEGEDATLQMLRFGGNFVDEKHLQTLLEWYQKHQ